LQEPSGRYGEYETPYPLPSGAEVATGADVGDATETGAVELGEGAWTFSTTGAATDVVELVEVGLGAGGGVDEDEGKIVDSVPWLQTEGGAAAPWVAVDIGFPFGST
jgi:hypothetical protein